MQSWIESYDVDHDNRGPSTLKLNYIWKHLSGELKQGSTFFEGDPVKMCRLAHYFEWRAMGHAPTSSQILKSS